MAENGRRERRKAEVRGRIASVAIDLFMRHGFDAVSVTQIAEAADVARPTVFAHFPRKEDLVFDRYPHAARALADAVRQGGERPWDALRAHLVAQGDDIAAERRLAFWRLVAGSRALQARARELAEELESALAVALAEQGCAEPALCAAMIAGAYRSAHVDAIRRVLAGEPAGAVSAQRAERIALALDVLERAAAGLGSVAGDPAPRPG